MKRAEKFFRELWARVKERRGLFLVLAASGVAAFVIGCPIKKLTGVSCPSCGISRALLSALTGDFSAAFYYHPLFWLIAPLIVYLLFGKYPLFGSRRRQNALLGLAVIIILGVWIYRLFILKNSVIGIDIEQSIMVKLTETITTFFVK